MANFGIGVEEAWSLTVREFVAIGEIKQKQARAAAGLPEPTTAKRTEALSDHLKAKGIIDSKGLVRRGDSS